MEFLKIREIREFKPLAKNTQYTVSPGAKIWRIPRFVITQPFICFCGVYNEGVCTVGAMLGIRQRGLYLLDLVEKGREGGVQKDWG